MLGRGAGYESSFLNSIMAKVKSEKTTKTVKAKVASSEKPVKVEKAPTVRVKIKKAPKAAKVAVVDEMLDQTPSPEKQEIISQFQVKEGDTGSPEVQVALLTKRIEKLVLHLKTNTTDNHSRRGLLGIVSKRRRLLNYLEKKDHARYKTVVSKLELGK
jgi:small subunit ribosomal protein S15